MSDVDMTSSKLLKNSFVHMQRCRTGTLPPIFNCQCTMHSILSHLNENEQNSACSSSSKSLLYVTFRHKRSFK